MGKSYRDKRKAKGKATSQPTSSNRQDSLQINEDNELSRCLAHLNLSTQSKDHHLDFNRGEVNFREVNRQIKRFIRALSEETLELDPCRSDLRALIHQLAHMYKLDSFSSGEGDTRFCILKKNVYTYIPSDFRKIDAFIIHAQKRASRPLGTNKESRAKSAHSHSAKVANGTIIGQNLKPIEDDNVGKALLCKFGWSPGNGLGPDGSGQTDPISAVFKKDRKGLGS